MLIQEPGRLTDRIDFLGTGKICLHLIKGEEAMIIGGGMSWVVPSLERQFSTIGFDFNRVRYLVIPHSHFDHWGAVPYLKGKFPHIQIVASARSKELLSKEKVLNAAATANKELIKKLGLEGECGKFHMQFDGIQVDRVVAENDVIDLGDGIEARFIEAPGHSKCSLAVYVPGLKAMFPSDSAPFPTEDGSELSPPSPQYDFSLYLESLRKLAAYDVEICCFEHNGAFVGDQAKNILQQGLKRTEEFKNYVLHLYQQTADLDKLGQKLANEEMALTKFPILDMELQISVSRTVVRNILG